jgi:hypothetical protein
MMNMNRVLCAVIVAVSLCWAGSVRAEVLDAGDSVEVKGMKMPGMEDMTGAMMKAHPSARQAVATSDGGVVIISGDSVVKYDKNLKLVNEVVLNTGSFPGCRTMKKDCPMMKDQMKKCCPKKESMKKGCSKSEANVPHEIVPTVD